MTVVKKTTVGILCAMTTLAAGGGETWKFDRLDQIGGHKTTLLGHPRVIDTPRGKAVEFNGVDDAIYLGVHPLAGVEAYTWEVIFRPDKGGAPEQRFFHFQEDGSDNRMLFEIRLVGNEWCLDSFAKSGENSRAVMDRAKLHPAGEWYAVEAVYDGHELRNYIDGVLEGQGELHMTPQKAGQTSIGVRFNKVNYFKGAVRTARMTPRALQPAEFLRK
jgi:Concanavalin A-like lectin/glucanases superfamily